MQHHDHAAAAEDLGPGYLLSAGNDGIDRVERDDEAGIFPHDDAARAHFLAQLKAGDAYACDIAVRLLQPLVCTTGSSTRLARDIHELLRLAEQLPAVDSEIGAALVEGLRDASEQVHLLEVVASVLAGLLHQPDHVDTDRRF